MANSKYEYVKAFESHDHLLSDTWIVLRIDGVNFHRFSSIHGFEKPNDLNALNLMNAAAGQILVDFPDILLAYGQSDEFSFIMHPSSRLYRRKASKILSTIVSLFTAHYQYLWKKHVPSVELQYPPTFDGRIVLYPRFQHIRDYLAWRQVDCHINNLYNTCFWNLVLSGKTKEDAEKSLRGSFSKDKHELLFSTFNINYNALPEIFRKGSTLFRDSTNSKISVLHVDIIRDAFWKEHPSLNHPQT